MRWTERKDSREKLYGFGSFLGPVGKTLIQRGVALRFVWPFCLRFLRVFHGCRLGRLAYWPLPWWHASWHRLFFEAKKRDDANHNPSIFSWHFFKRFSTGICRNHFCQIFVAGIVAMAHVAQKTMGIRGLLPPMLWLNSCSSFEEIVAKSSCAAKIWRYQFSLHQILRYFVAKAWCEDRLTIQDAKALSTLWKQLSRGVATWRGCFAPRMWRDLRHLSFSLVVKQQ